MADAKALKVKLILGATKGKPVRFSHLHVFEARLNKESGRLEYSVAVLIPKTNVEDVAAIKAAIDALKKDEWLSKGKKLPPQFWNPLRDGDNDTKQDGSPLGVECQGNYVLNCKTGEDSTIDVVGTTKGADGKFVRLGQRDVKSGDWGRVGINMGAYIKGAGGVGAYLSNLQLTRQGDPLAASRSAEDDFSGFEDEDDADSMLD